MSERIQEIAGIIFALAFVAILAMISTGVIDMGTSVNNRLSRSYADTEAYELQAFDNVKVTGSTVISAVNNRDNLYTIPLTITLNGNEITSTSTSYGAVNYVNSGASYNASLLVNANGVVYGIAFTS